MSGFWKIGTSGFGKLSVKGRRRVPRPAPRTNACVIEAIALTIPHGRNNRLARHVVAMEKRRPISARGAPGCNRDRHFRRNATHRLRRIKEYQLVHLGPCPAADFYGALEVSPNEK